MEPDKVRWCMKKKRGNRLIEGKYKLRLAEMEELTLVNDQVRKAIDDGRNKVYYQLYDIFEMIRKSHTGEKPYECELSEYKLTQNGNLK